MPRTSAPLANEVALRTGAAVPSPPRGADRPAPILKLQLGSPIERLRRALRAVRRRWLQRHARRAQAAYCKTFIAITGSCGKTTAAALTEQLLLATGATGGGTWLYNQGVYLVRALAKLRRPVDFFVQEVGINGPGSIEALTNYVDIDVAVVTAVGFDHGSAFHVPNLEAPDAIAAEKGKLVEAIRAGGVACLNADDPRVAAMAARTDARVLTYGRAAGADLRAENVSARWPARLGFDLLVGGQRHRVETRFVGTIMLPSVLAALAVVHGLGRSLELAIVALRSIEPPFGRMTVVDGADGRSYVLDTVKAPHWSTRMLAGDLEEIGGKDTMFVLGEMSDMRSGRSRHYAGVARIAAQHADHVVLTGAAAEADKRLRADLLPNLVIAPTLEDAARAIAASPARLVILKGTSGALLRNLPAMVDAMSPLEGQHDAE